MSTNTATLQSVTTNAWIQQRITDLDRYLKHIQGTDILPTADVQSLRESIAQSLYTLEVERPEFEITYSSQIFDNPQELTKVLSTLQASAVLTESEAGGSNLGQEVKESSTDELVSDLFQKAQDGSLLEDLFAQQREQIKLIEERNQLANYLSAQTESILRQELSSLFSPDQINTLLANKRERIQTSILRSLNNHIPEDPRQLALHVLQEFQDSHDVAIRMAGRVADEETTVNLLEEAITKSGEQNPILKEALTHELRESDGSNVHTRQQQAVTRLLAASHDRHMATILQSDPSTKEGRQKIADSIDSYLKIHTDAGSSLNTTLTQVNQALQDGQSPNSIKVMLSAVGSQAADTATLQALESHFLEEALPLNQARSAAKTALQAAKIAGLTQTPASKLETTIHDLVAQVGPEQTQSIKRALAKPAIRLGFHLAAAQSSQDAPAALGDLNPLEVYKLVLAENLSPQDLVQLVAQHDQAFSIDSAQLRQALATSGPASRTQKQQYNLVIDQLTQSRQQYNPQLLRQGLSNLTSELRTQLVSFRLPETRLRLVQSVQRLPAGIQTRFFPRLTSSFRLPTSQRFLTFLRDPIGGLKSLFGGASGGSLPFRLPSLGGRGAGALKRLLSWGGSSAKALGGKLLRGALRLGMMGARAALSAVGSIVSGLVGAGPVGWAILTAVSLTVIAAIIIAFVAIYYSMNQGSRLASTQQFALGGASYVPTYYTCDPTDPDDPDCGTPCDPTTQDCSWPLQCGCVTQGPNATHKKASHTSANAVDFGVGGCSERSVTATHDGTLEVMEFSFRDGEGTSYGNWVKVIKDDGSYTLYAHLAHGTIPTELDGERITQGTVLGLANDTGNSTGPHLHYEYISKTGESILSILPLTQEQIDTLYACYGTSDCGGICI